MNESFLYYIWQYLYFNKSGLQTTDGDSVQILDPGMRNSDSGPDFVNARIKIGNLEWRGHVEIHTQASDWIKHKHDDDPAYENVVLHVVWNSDKPLRRSDLTAMPTLELRDRVEEQLIRRYRKLVQAPQLIPCATLFDRVSSVAWRSQVDRALVQRLQNRAGAISTQLKANDGDWEETCYQLLCRNFGFKVNTTPFESLAAALPYKTVLKNANRPISVEAMVFGVAGLLNHPGKDPYCRSLANEYRHLAAKYGLKNKELHPVNWKFMRLRPANFPTIRLAQVSALLAQRKNLFSTLVAQRTPVALKRFFHVEVNPYWKSHYRFGTKATKPVGALGDDAIHNLIMNTVAPLLFTYGRSKGNDPMADRALSILESLPAESNSILRKWKEIGVQAHTAFESQGLIEQYNAFCLKRQCLSCKAGAQLLNPIRL